MAYKTKKKKKPLKPKKMLVSKTRKQYDLLKLHCAYKKKTPVSVLKKAINIYMRQVNHDIKHWQKIAPDNLCEEDKIKQMEIDF